MCYTCIVKGTTSADIGMTSIFNTILNPFESLPWYLMIGSFISKQIHLFRCLGWCTFKTSFLSTNDKRILRINGKIFRKCLTSVWLKLLRLCLWAFFLMMKSLRKETKVYSFYFNLFSWIKWAVRAISQDLQRKRRKQEFITHNKYRLS